MALDPNNFSDELRKATKKVLQDIFAGGGADGKSYGRDFAKGLQDSLKSAKKDFQDAFKEARADKQLLDVMTKTGLRGVFAEEARILELKGALDEAETKRLLKAQKSLDHIQEQNELVRELARWQLELNEELEQYSKGWEKIKSKIKAIVTDPQVAKAVFLTSMAEKAHEVYESFEKLEQSGLTVGQRVDYMAKGFSLMSAVGLSDTKGVLDEMVATMGTMNSLTSAEVDHVGHLAKEMGVSGQEAFQLVEGFSKLPGETMATAAHAADYVKSLSKANGVAPGKITKEIAKNTELIALGGYKGAKAFADAAMKAQKMGVELSTTSKVMNGLLNFENSINKQMEASVLLGKEINLDRARQLALEGKSVEATEEVLKNIGGQAAFDKMNVLQKQALAEATGMTVGELNKAVDAQAEYNKYHGEDVSAWKSGLGYMMEWGGAGVKFMNESGMAILAAIQLIQTLNLKKVAGYLADKAHGVWEKVSSIWRTADKTKEIAQEEVLNEVKREGALIDKTKTGGIAASVGPMLAFGAAVLMVGAGVALAAVGLAQLVSAFKDLTGQQILGALGALIVVMGGFAIMVNVLAGASITAAPGLLALGGAILMIGLGIGIAAAGMSLFVSSLSEAAKNADGVWSLGSGLFYVAEGLGAIAAAGVLAIPAIAGLSALNNIGLDIKSSTGGAESESGPVVKVLEEVKGEIAKLAAQPVIVNIDGSKVGEAVRLKLKPSFGTKQA